MFALPIATDAPIYRWPFVTLALVAANVIVFRLTGAYLQPTPLHMVAAWLSLVGNVLFLWSFGLVTEGKLGWWRFLAVYLGMALVLCAFDSKVMYSTIGYGGVLGTSSVTIGLLGMCVVWAPRNEFKVCYVFVGYPLQARIGDVSILSFSGLYVGWEVLMLALTGFQLTNVLMHLLGFVLGVGLGIVLLKLRQVDCEGWDLLATWAGKLPTSIDIVERRKQAEATNERFTEKQEKELQMGRGAALDMIERHLREGRPGEAYALVMKHAGVRGDGWQLPDPLMTDIIESVTEREMWPQAIRLLRWSIADHPALATDARLRLAHILIHVEQRPRQAQAVLGKLPLSLPEAQTRRRDELMQTAQQAIDEGTLEVATEDW